MRARLWIIFATTLLLLFVTLGNGIHLIQQQFLQLDAYPDTQLVSGHLEADIALSLCLASVNQRQTLRTTRSDGVIWQRSAAHWHDGEAAILGAGAEARFQRHPAPFITARSRLFFRHDEPFNQVFVNNRLSLELPGWVCGTPSSFQALSAPLPFSKIAR